MRFMMKFTWKQPPTDEVTALMPAEQRRGQELAEQGISEAVYMAEAESAEAWTIWAVWNRESRDAVDELAKTLPLYKFLNYEATPLID